MSPVPKSSGMGGKHVRFGPDHQPVNARAQQVAPLSRSRAIARLPRKRPGNMRTRRSPALVLLTVMAVAPTAQAQPRPLYAGVGIIADTDRTNSRLTETTAASWTIVGGLDVTP